MSTDSSYSNNSENSGSEHQGSSVSSSVSSSPGSSPSSSSGSSPSSSQGSSPSSSSGSSSNLALSIQNLDKKYTNGVHALKGVDLSVKEGEFYGLLGPNGAGKSTILNILTSLVLKTSGTVKIFGYDIDKDFDIAKRYIGYVPQEFNFSTFEKVFNIVVTQAGFYGVPRKIACQRAEYYLKKLDLWDKRDQLSRRLSGGMKRRLMIARALVHEPKLLILDEPTAGVDIEIRRSMWEFLREINQNGVTIILTSHYLEEIEQLCPRIGIIDQGKLVLDTSTRDLIRHMPEESFILDCSKNLPINVDTLEALAKFAPKRVDDRTLDVSLHKGQNVTELFTALEADDVVINSMRNSANRLEELFLSLLARNKNESSHK